MPLGVLLYVAPGFIRMKHTLPLEGGSCKWNVRVSDSARRVKNRTAKKTDEINREGIEKTNVTTSVRGGSLT